MMSAFLVAVLWVQYKSKIRSREEEQERRAKFSDAVSTDPIWREEALLAHVASVFTQYQSDWSQFNVVNMQRYLSPEYLQHMTLVLSALKLANRQNAVQNIEVTGVHILDIDDKPDDTKDMFSAEVSFSVDDSIIDTQNARVLHTRRFSGSETYRFTRQGDNWLLNGIGQPTEDLYNRSASIAEFAAQNDMFYSLDWGHLLLPDRGQLFADGDYSVSDINNHVIGVYHGLVIQIYSYIAIPGTSSEYTVAQVYIPKSYGNILVRRRQGTLSSLRNKPQGMHQLKTEWGQFNEMYEVYATDLELAASFELLTPVYMEALASVGFDVNIEVAGNVVYIYTKVDAKTVTETIRQVIQPTDNINTDQYAVMLTLLKTAFREMRL